MQRLMIVLAAMVIVVAGAAAIVLTLRPGGVELSPAMVNVEGSDIGGPFELTAHTGDKMTDTAVIDRPTLIYFGYTYCPDVCPVDTAVMAEAVDLLAERGLDVRPVFITVDPARDRPEDLAYYAEALHPKMIALTGTEAEIDAVAKSYRVYYQKVDAGESSSEYLMNHSAFTYLVVPDEGLVALFRRDFPAEQIAGDVERVLSAL